MRIREQNIIDWQKWFIILILCKKLDITLFDNWMKNHKVDDPYPLIEKLQKNHTREFAGILTSAIVLSISFIINFLSETNLVGDMVTIAIILIIIALIKYSKLNTDTRSKLIYQFRTEYQSLITDLNLGLHQKDYTLESLRKRAEYLLKQRASTLKDIEKSQGSLCDLAEGHRKSFKHDHALFKIFGLAEDSYDTYFKEN
jgi:hypothetical protein